MTLANSRHDRRRRRDAPAVEFGCRQDTGPGIEELYGIGTGLDLPVEIVDRRTDEDIDQPPEQVGGGQRHSPDAHEIMPATALDHVGGDRPRAAGEADQGLLQTQRRPDARNRLVDRRQPRADSVAGRFQPCHRGGIAHRLQDRALALLEGQPHIERMRDQKDVGEEDRRIHVETAQRLQRHLRGQFRIQAEAHEIPAALAKRPVFGKIAASLAHEPERCARGALAGKRAQERG